ncbi:MAG: twin-arginine translocation signal domain-containing protein, partial [Acidobacteria bacterium]
MMNRRDFMKGSLLSGAAAGLASRAVAQSEQKDRLPSDRVTVGVIGTGARAQQLMDAALTVAGVEIVAVSDAYSGRAQRAQERAGGKAKIHRDYREILANKGIDAVIIGTPDHWHKDMAVQ